ncbi:MAG: N-acetyltransferase family protein [Minwuia sp.]|uniref:GNAT family N-acetyltransferase n=1 Tax=Minwuia sp. TaxID=2493630 RepID=UPI003A8952FB
MVRSAGAGDIPAITDIYRHWVETSTSTFELEAPSDDEMQRRFEGYLEAGYPYLAATVGERVAGYAYAGAYRPRPAYRFTAENSIYVSPDAVGTGIGRLLLRALLDRLEADGYRSVIAVVGDPDANRASIALHQSAGFREFGRAKAIGFKFERWLDVAYLQLRLADSG